MKRPHITLLFFSCLAAAPLAAQTTIGGNPCTSAFLNGYYAASITGRQVNASGTFTGVFQANGTLTFDGQRTVYVNMTADTNQAVATPLAWTGNYSVQANCVGLINITSGSSATFNLVLFDNGANILLTGSDATFSYAGNGNAQPTGCSASLLSGVYTYSATGFSLSSTAINGATNATGLLQFDGQGHVTANLSFAPTNSNAATLTGTYTVGSNCQGTATLSDSKGGSYVMSLSLEGNIPAAAPLYSTPVFVGLAESGKFIVTGGANAIYGQPTATTAAVRVPADRRGRS